jgi:very-short-patch-repair endonuclease
MRKPKEIKGFARRMRYRLTGPEMTFLRRLARTNICGFDFQIRIGFYIADFVIPEKMLVIEIDGITHEKQDAQKYDKRRSEFLAEAGFTVWRIRNKEVDSWPLQRIAEHKRPLEGRGYEDAIRWANQQFQPRKATRPPTEDQKAKWYRKLLKKTETIQQAEKERISSPLPRVIRVVKKMERTA